MGVVGSTPDLLVDEPIVVQEHCLFLGFWVVITRMSSISTNLARHASFQGLKCLHLSLIFGIILKFLEEEINLHSEHVSFLDSMHAPLTWLESIIAPSLVGHHLLN